MASIASGGADVASAPVTPFRPFCDQCGKRFKAGQLRPRSQYCNYCGEELSAWIKRRLSLDFVAMIAPQTPPITPANHPRVLETPRRLGTDEEDFVAESVRGRGRWGTMRGKGRLRRRGRGRGRGEIQPVVGTARVSPRTHAADAELGRGLRVSSRPDYSVQNYYRGAFGRTRGMGIANVIADKVWILMISLATNVDDLISRPPEVQPWYSLLTRLTDEAG